MTRSRLVGINHVALEVDDVERALAFYSTLFDFKLRGRETGATFIDLGDQFLALMERGAEENERHFGLVVPDKEIVRRALEAAQVAIAPGHRLDFHDPFGNRIQVVQYDQIQFTKAEGVLQGMKLDLDKNEAARAELRQQGLL